MWAEGAASGRSRDAQQGENAAEAGLEEDSSGLDDLLVCLGQVRALSYMPVSASRAFYGQSDGQTVEMAVGFSLLLEDLRCFHMHVGVLLPVFESMAL